ncbi:hypothetical protein [Luteimicrobium sp. DT211]|uniref:hypothetical protein n=1 Tax=Luteimicrobium sp. DT211 TaxID=3393412 RepID=UPI003CF4AD22
MTANASLSDDERAELQSLRAEVTRLRQEASSSGGAGGGAPDGATSAGPRRRRQGWVRWTATGVLVVLAALLAISAVGARYVRSQLLDTDRYVATVAPLADDPAVQNAVATKVTDAIVQQLDLETLTRNALTAITDNAPRVPEQIVGLAPVLASQANGFIGDQVTRFVRSDAFANLWVQANRAAHANVVAVLTGGSGRALTGTADGAVVLDLGPVVDTVKQRLVARGLSFASNIPQVTTTITVFQSSDLAKAQRWTRAFDRLATWLPWIALLVAALAVGVAPPGRRRRAVVVAASAVALGMIVLGLGITIGRAVYLGAVPAHVLPPSAAAVVFDSVVQPLRGTLRFVLVVALVVALASFLVGPGGAAQAVRNGFMWLVGRASGGRAGDTAREPRPWEAWIARYAVLLTVALVVLGGLVLVFWHYPTGAVAFWIALLTVVLVVAVQVLAAPGRHAAAARQVGGTTPA